VKDKKRTFQVRSTVILLVALNVVKKLLFYCELSICKRYAVLTNVSDGFHLTFELFHDMGRIGGSADCNYPLCLWNVLGRCYNCGAA